MAFSIEDLKSTVVQQKGFARSNLFLVLLPSTPPSWISSTSNNSVRGFLNAIGNAINTIQNVATSVIDSIGGIVGVQTGNSTLAILCKATNVPGRRIISTDRIIAGQKQQIANGFADEEVTMTFWVTNDMMIKKYFESWQQAAYNQETSEAGYYKDYVMDLKIQMLQKGGGTLIGKSSDLGLPDVITNNLPRTGAATGGQIGIFGPQDVIATYRLVEAWPTSVVSIPLTDDNSGLLELTVTFTYKRWEVKSGSTGNGYVSAAVGSAIDFFDK